MPACTPCLHAVATGVVTAEVTRMGREREGSDHLAQGARDDGCEGFERAGRTSIARRCCMCVQIWERSCSV